MRKFTKHLLALLLMVAGVVNANAQEQIHATFENPSNTNTTWDGATRTFTWSTTYYNQLRNIGLPSGDITGYKKLVVDCKITEGTQFRILFYQGNANKTLYAKDGVNEFIIAEALKEVAPDDWNSFMKDCTEICLSGDNGAAPGEAIINDVYLETYPEGEELEIPDVVEEEDPGRPEGDFVDLTTYLFNGENCTYNVGEKKAKGDVIYGGMSQEQYADLSGYSKLTVVATPGMPIVLTFNHQIDFADKQNKEDYEGYDEADYVWVDGVVGEDGIYEYDLTQLNPVNLNYVRIPWSFDKQGTVWYLLLTEGATEPEASIEIEREVGQGYGAQSETIDFTAAKEYLGVEEITYDMIRIVNPDGSMISDYAPFDGWFNAEGTAETWGQNTKICVKFFQMIENGEYQICDMNGADEVGATYTVKWALTANDKTYRYNISVTFVPQQAVEREIADKMISASVEYDSSDASYLEKSVTLSDEDLQAILSELGLTSLEEATVFGYNPTTKELISAYAAYDGWRDANGDFASWTGNATVPACVKYTDGKSYLCYNINGCEAQTVKAYWAIANDTKAVLVEISFTYTSASEPEPVDEDLIEIAQSQGKEYDDFTRTDLVEGEEYNTYTAHGDLNIAIKMMDVDVEGCDYVVIKFAEPVAAGWNLAFWSNQDLVAVPEGVTEYKYVFAEDPNCGVSEDGILPQICMMTFFGAPETLEAKVVGIYKHKAEDADAIANIKTPAQKAGKYFQNGQVFILKNGVKYNVAGQKIK
ncbi:MAG: hypothetical protein J5616_07465 [Bacteroidaceae bacterium]|nr:hypothetical protein [Bacteroidaceae bacterium]